MARGKQIQKTRTKTKTKAAVTATKVQVTQRQSLELVQTLIHGGLSCLMFLRELFAESAFNYGVYQKGAVIPYEDYANCNLAQSTEGLSKPYTEMRILRRDKSSRVDTFLKWLEKGAFPLMADGRLQAIEIYVHEGGADRSKVIETYSFTIRYHADGSGIKSPVGIEVGSPGTKPMTVGKANSDLREVLEAIKSLCAALPSLPAQRTISTELFYCSDDHVKLDDFVPSRSDKLFFAHADGWRKQDNTKTLEAGYHGTMLKVSNLTLCESDWTIPGATPPNFPDQLEYPEPISRLRELGLSEVEDPPVVIEETQAQPPNVKKSGRTSSVTTGHEIVGQTAQDALVEQIPTPRPAAPSPANAPGRHKSKKTVVADPGPSPLRPSQLFNDSLDTQSSHVPRMKKALQGMMITEPLTQGDTQTQAVVQPAQRTPSQVGADATPTTASGLDLRDSTLPHQTPAYPRFSNAKREREEDDIFSSPAGRGASNTSVYKRMKSSQSRVLLNANGLSSPAPYLGS